MLGKYTHKLLRTSNQTLRLLSTTQQASQQVLKTNYQPQGDKMMRHHGHYRFDAYNDIRHDKKWQQRIIKREDENFEKWVELVAFHYEQWRKHVFGRTDPATESMPEKYGDYIYFLRHKEYTKKGIKTGKESAQSSIYDIYCRHRHDEPTKEEAVKNTQTILDLEEVPFVSQKMFTKTIIDKVKMNDDHSLVAFTLDIGGSEKLTAGIKDMKKNEVLSNFKLEGVSSLEFGKGHDTVFYVETDEMNRPCKVRKLTLSTMKESIIFVDQDPTHYVEIGQTKDGKYLLISSNTKEDSEVWVIDRDEASAEGDKVMIPKLLIPRREGVKAHIDHLRDFFVMITNHGVKSKNYKLTTLSDEIFKQGSAGAFSDKWEDLIHSNEGYIIAEFDCFKDFLVVYIKNQGRPELLIQDMTTRTFTSITLEDVGEIHPGLNQDYDTQQIRFSFTSPFTYNQLYEYNHVTKGKRLIKEYKLAGSPQIIRNQFECKQFLVPSHDGEEVPMNLYYKKGMNLDRRNKTLLEGYGAYGLNLHQSFNIVHTSAMEKGWVIAQAFVRGGGEKGIQWHEQGKLSKKPNSFKDFIACAEYLIAQRITHPNLLAAKGSSAGGTLVAQACMNMHPELFRACLLNVPFLDVLSCLVDESLPLSATDHLEFGNPIKDEKMYQLINSFSPYENLSKREYPSVLMNVSLTDPRVPHWTNLKFIEKLRDMANAPQRFPDFGAKNIVVRLNKEGGHFGAMDNDINLAMGTFEFAWLDYIMFKKQNL